MYTKKKKGVTKMFSLFVSKLEKLFGHILYFYRILLLRFLKLKTGRGLGVHHCREKVYAFSFFFFLQHSISDAAHVLNRE